MSEEHSPSGPENRALQDRDPPPVEPPPVEPGPVEPGPVEPGPVEPSAAAPEPAAIGEAQPSFPPDAAAPARRAARFPLAVVWLALLLALLVIGVALSPFWAPAVAPLLPWGAKASLPAANYAALDKRVRALDARLTALADRVPTLASRVAALEDRRGPSSADVDALKTAQAAQAQQLDRLAAALAADHPEKAALAANATALQQLIRRVAAIDAQTAGTAADTGKEHQQLDRLGAAATDLGNRLAALERQVRAQGLADRAGPALLLAVEQMRQAVAQGRSFEIAYHTFSGLARGDPALTAGAAPLAEAARDGVPSRAALSRRLDALAGKLDRTASAPVAASSWWQQALDRTRGLVTIRRIGTAGDNTPRAAIEAARSALADGDLGAAIAAIDRLGGDDAETAKPWLRTARSRLAAEAAVAHLQNLLAVRLGATATPATPAAPAAGRGQGQATPAVAPRPGNPNPAPSAPANPNPASSAPGNPNPAPAASPAGAPS